MLDFLKEYSFILGALTGGLAAYVLSLIVNYFTRERKILAYSVASRKIVERGHKDIQILYRGKTIERLLSHQVSIRNAGNRALKDIPIRASFQNGNFVDFEVRSPEGANFTITPENDNKTLVIECDLLNRGEKFDIGFTSIDSESSKINITARAENLQCKEIDDSTFFVEPSTLVATIVYQALKVGLKTILSK